MAHFLHWDTSIPQFMMQDAMNSAVILTPQQRYCQYNNLECFPSVQGKRKFRGGEASRDVVE